MGGVNSYILSWYRDKEGGQQGAIKKNNNSASSGGKKWFFNRQTIKKQNKNSILHALFSKVKNGMVIDPVLYSRSVKVLERKILWTCVLKKCRKNKVCDKNIFVCPINSIYVGSYTI